MGNITESTWTVSSSTEEGVFINQTADNEINRITSTLYQVGDILQIYIQPFISGLGIPTNLSALMVFLGKGNRNLSPSIYLACIAAFDCFHLTVNSIEYMATMIMKRDFTETGCILFSYFTVGLMTSSNLILV